MSGRCKADAEQGRREACPNAGEKRFTLTQPRRQNHESTCNLEELQEASGVGRTGLQGFR